MCACLSATSSLACADGGQLGNLHVHQILFLGNSITCCPPNYWGLAASTAEKDYAHLLVRAINAKTGGSLTLIRATSPRTSADGRVDLGESNVVNIADVFERGYASYSAAKLQKQIAWKADIVVLQFGENIPPATFQAEVFKASLKKLVADLQQSSNPHIFMPGYILGANADRGRDETKRLRRRSRPSRVRRPKPCGPRPVEHRRLRAPQRQGNGPDRRHVV